MMAFTITAHVVGVNEPGAPGLPPAPGVFNPQSGQMVPSVSGRPVATLRIGNFGETIRVEVPTGELLSVGDDIPVTVGTSAGTASAASPSAPAKAS